MPDAALPLIQPTHRQRDAHRLDELVAVAVPPRRFSLFVSDLSRNALARVAPIALALRERHEVEVLGFLLDSPEVYAPYRDTFEAAGIPVRAIDTSCGTLSVLRAIPRLAALATGDVMVAFKPILSSFGPALWASRVRRLGPLLLDVDDDEWIASGTTFGEIVRRDVLKGWRHQSALKYTLTLHPLTRLAAGVTVVSRKLQTRYGGVLLRHPVDLAVFDPGRADLPAPAATRERYGLPAHRRLALFAGVSRAHKGLDLVVDALGRPECAGWDLVLAGPDRPNEADFGRAEAALGSRCHRLGVVPYDAMPALVAAVDAVPVLQQPTVFTESQVPLKLLEALAAGTPVIGTAVGDVPELLGFGTRGLIVAPDAASAAAAFAEIAADPAAAERRATAARAFVETEASATAARERIEVLVARAVTS